MSIMFAPDEVISAMTATEFVRKLNEESSAEMAAEPGLWIGLLVDDATHWSRYNCKTGLDVAMYLGACRDREEEKARWDY